jgi:DNA gyrase/topoisomerase IV subunit B
MIAVLDRHRRADYNIQRLRYHKVIIMTDATIAHPDFSYLLFRQMSGHGKGHSMWPVSLYRVADGKREQHIKDDKPTDFLSEGSLKKKS